MTVGNLEARLDEIDKGEKRPAGAKDTVTLKSELERSLEEEDAVLARELSRTRAETIIAQRKEIIKQIQDRTIGQSAATKTDEKGGNWLVSVTSGLLDRGVDTKVVSQIVQYLLGNAQAPIALSTAGQQGFSLKDLKELYEFMSTSNKSSNDLKDILNRLVDEVTSLKHLSLSAPAPSKYVVVQPDGSVEEVESGHPIIIKAPVAVATGESVELVTARLKHDENMEQIKSEAKYKDVLGKTISEMPERIGRGIASGMTETEKREEVTQGPVSFTCLKCGTKIPTSADAAQIECPNPECRAIHSRKG